MGEMTGKQGIVLDFGSLVLDAELFDSPVAARFAARLPCTVELEKWGDELYGPLGADLGEDSPTPRIPSGGIAYTNRGAYLCIFFGQTPAWPVDYIGQIGGDAWRHLKGNTTLASVTVRAKP